jgi:hypothetical protein
MFSSVMSRGCQQVPGGVKPGVALVLGIHQAVQAGATVASGCFSGLAKAIRAIEKST